MTRVLAVIRQVSRIIEENVDTSFKSSNNLTCIIMHNSQCTNASTIERISVMVGITFHRYGIVRGLYYLRRLDSIFYELRPRRTSTTEFPVTRIVCHRWEARVHNRWRSSRITQSVHGCTIPMESRSPACIALSATRKPEWFRSSYRDPTFPLHNVTRIRRRSTPPLKTSVRVYAKCLENQVHKGERIHTANEIGRDGRALGTSGERTRARQEQDREVERMAAKWSLDLIQRESDEAPDSSDEISSREFN